MSRRFVVSVNKSELTEWIIKKSGGAIPEDVGVEGISFAFPDNRVDFICHSFSSMPSAEANGHPMQRFFLMEPKNNDAWRIAPMLGEV